MTGYVAFLRGINVGGNKRIRMKDLRQMLSGLGLQNVQTVLASGNAYFEADDSDMKGLTEKIEDAINRTFGFGVDVTLRTNSDIQNIIHRNPFKDVEVDENVRLYVTFFDNKLTSALELPWESPEQDFRILDRTEREVFSVLHLTPGSRTVDSMAFIEKEFGVSCTTRNWNTVNKVVAFGKE